MKIYFIDLFCGAGGVTTGIHQAEIDGKPIAEVIACVNHDPLAIKSHAANYPNCKHYQEDIRSLDLTELIQLTHLVRVNDPESVICLWASLECTNFSKAKGGQPRNADSRTLAEHLYRYVEALDPDFIFIENVEEFMSWGPLDDRGKPISKQNGRDYLRWIENVKAYGYDYGYRVLNCADYGAYTSRKRYFAQFAKPGFEIKWPIPTHSKNPEKSMFTETMKWNAVEPCLDLNDEGKSIFGRLKELSPKTLERIFAGCIKYIVGGEDIFIAKYFSGRPEGKVISINGPAGTIRCIDGQSVVKIKFLTQYYSGGSQIKSIKLPCPALPTKDRVALISFNWLDKQYSGSDNHQSIESPSGAILPNDKHCLATADKIYYLFNPAWGGTNNDVNQPCCVIVARQDKAPLYIIEIERKNVFEMELGNFLQHLDLQFLNDISNDIYGPMIQKSIRVKIIEFMAIYGIVDIKMRMLKISELLKIQGFDDDYILEGNQTNQKKFIGNSVPPPMVKALIEGVHGSLYNLSKAV